MIRIAVLCLSTLVLASTFLLAAGQPSEKVANDADQEAKSIVEGFVEAYNKHDVAGMIALAADDIAWHSIAGDQIATEASGADALAKSMTGYFKSIPSVRSEIEGMTVSGSFVAVRERAFWKQGDKERSQYALAVYEIRDTKIKRVYYYAAER